jgi:hypothetical protein
MEWIKITPTTEIPENEDLLFRQKHHPAIGADYYPGYVEYFGDGYTLWVNDQMGVNPYSSKMQFTHYAVITEPKD